MTYPMPEYGSVAEAAKLWRTGEHSIRSGIRDGSIPHIKVGRHIRIPIRQINDRMQKGTPSVDTRGSEDEPPARGDHRA